VKLATTEIQNRELKARLGKEQGNEACNEEVMIEMQMRIDELEELRGGHEAAMRRLEEEKELKIEEAVIEKEKSMLAERKRIMDEKQAAMDAKLAEAQEGEMSEALQIEKLNAELEQMKDSKEHEIEEALRVQKEDMLKVRKGIVEEKNARIEELEALLAEAKAAKPAGKGPAGKGPAGKGPPKKAAEIKTSADLVEAAKKGTKFYIHAHAGGKALEEKDGGPVLSAAAQGPSFQFSLTEQDGKYIFASKSKSELGVESGLLSSKLILHEPRSLEGSLAATVGVEHNKFTVEEAGNGKFYVEMGSKHMAESGEGALELSTAKTEAEQWAFVPVA